MFRRLQDEQARLQDQVNRNEDRTYDRILELRARDTEREREMSELKERLAVLEGRPVPVARAPVRCRICGESGHMANNSKFHPLMAPIFRAANPVQAQNPVMMTPANIQR